jgi:hypothetical protein
MLSQRSLHASTLGTKHLRQCENNLARITSIHLRRPYARNGAVGSKAVVREGPFSANIGRTQCCENRQKHSAVNRPNMSFTELIKGILREHPQGLTPQQIREIIKREHPTYYGTEAHQRNVEKGHYKDLEHALLAQIYVTARSGGQFYVDKSFKPFVMSLVPGAAQEANLPDEEIEAESLEKLEAGIGRLYVLGTSLSLRTVRKL